MGRTTAKLPAHPEPDPPPARDRVPVRVPRADPPDLAAVWLARADADRHAPRRDARRGPRVLGCAVGVLVGQRRRRADRARLRRRRAVGGRDRGLRQRAGDARAVGDLRVVRARRPAVVRVRLGDPAARDRVPRGVPRAAARSAAARVAATTPGDDPAVPVARVPDHARRRADQAARRSVLARAVVPRHALRDAAAAESTVAVVPPPARRAPPGGRGVQPRRRARRAVAGVRPAQGAAGRLRRDARVPGLADHQRQPVVPQLADDRPDPRAARRRRDPAAVAGAAARVARRADAGGRARVARAPDRGGNARGDRRGAERRRRRQPDVAAPGDEPQLRRARSGQHVRRGLQTFLARYGWPSPTAE